MSRDVAREATLQRLGANLRELRKGNGLSQERLASIAGLDRTYVGGIERGERNVGIVNIAQLASALNVSASALVDGIP